MTKSSSRSGGLCSLFLENTLDADDTGDWCTPILEHLAGPLDPRNSARLPRAGCGVGDRGTQSRQPVAHATRPVQPEPVVAVVSDAIPV